MQCVLGWSSSVFVEFSEGKEFLSQLSKLTKEHELVSLTKAFSNGEKLNDDITKLGRRKKFI